MMIICGDCSGDHPGYAKTWFYPCKDCATAFLEAHREMGHAVRSRPITHYDRLVASGMF